MEQPPQHSERAARGRNIAKGSSYLEEKNESYEREVSRGGYRGGRGKSYDFTEERGGYRSGRGGHYEKSYDYGEERGGHRGGHRGGRGGHYEKEKSYEDFTEERGGHRSGRGGHKEERSELTQEEFVKQFAQLTLDEKETPKVEELSKVPKTPYTSLGVLPEIQLALISNKLTDDLKPVVSATLPPALEGKSLYCKAASGSGKKTLCSIAILHQVAKAVAQNPSSRGTLRAIIAVNQKGLAAELGDLMQKLAKYLTIKVFPVFGGVDKKLHFELLNQEKPDILVGTPGRLFQLFEENLLIPDNLQHFAIFNGDIFFDNQDFADLRNQTQKIFIKSPHEKQVLIFSENNVSEAAKSSIDKFLQSSKRELFYYDEEKK